MSRPAYLMLYQWRVFFWKIAVLAMFSGFALACPLCFSPDRKTVATEFKVSKELVLTKIDSKSPRKAQIVQRLKGGEGNSASEVTLETPVSFGLQNSDLFCLSFDGKVWKSLGSINESSLPVIHHILEDKTNWAKNAAAHQDYISQFFSDDSGLLREFAFSELASAPYSRIRSFASSLPQEKLNELLRQPSMANWSSLYILLMAQSRDEEHQQNIRDASFSISNKDIAQEFAPWVAALIEIDQKEALLRLRKTYLARSLRILEMEDLTRALSTHGNEGHQHLRPEIIQFYQDMVAQKKRASTTIIKDLHKWGESEMAQTIFNQTLPSFTLEQQLELRHFLKTVLSEQSEASMRDSSDTENKKGSQIVWVFLIVLCIAPMILQLLRFVKKSRKSD